MLQILSSLFQLFRLFFRKRLDVHDHLPSPLLLVLFPLEAHLSVRQAKQSVVSSNPAVFPGVPPRPSLPRYDVSRSHDFAAEFFYSQKLGQRISPVPRRPSRFLRRRSRGNLAKRDLARVVLVQRQQQTRTRTRTRSGFAQTRKNRDRL